MDMDLHEIEQMISLALKAQDSLLGRDTVPAFSKCRRKMRKWVSFCTHDLLKRVRALRAELYPQEFVKAPVLTLVRPQPDQSA